ncbi:tetratricopeptide repeat protein [Telmatocola sphagniphila]|uniref:Tetratricopeptide repeat protein n=1 Tax=Telmatocola sphagniphila TaxID=1123043 RepID=A0A8E6B1E0_9BACT|nr:tetratricopeptide repeat protein [Telmatocola sphagniphila]QVL30195.1 tetratricopeptide repeat protein [Telmatocola sphagniphila]
MAWQEGVRQGVSDYSEVIRLDPNLAAAYGSRGFAWLGKKEYDKALSDYDEAIRLDPKDALTWTHKVYLLALCQDVKLRDIPKAKELLKQVIELRKSSPYNNEAFSVIAAAEGRFDEAIKYQEQALNNKNYEKEDGEKARKRLELYKQKKPWRE